MLAVLFTETGLMPIRIRRLLLALARLRYMVDRRVRWALLDSVDLFAAGNACWAGDIAILLRALPTPIRIVPADFLSIPTIDAISKKVAEATDADLQFDINFLQKTHLLRDRLELAGDSNTLALVTRRRRHYLTMVAVPAHRMALTRMLLSDHNLSVERLRYRVRYRLPIPREERLCRFCRGGSRTRFMPFSTAMRTLRSLIYGYHSSVRSSLWTRLCKRHTLPCLTTTSSIGWYRRGRGSAAGKICVRCLHGLQCFRAVYSGRLRSWWRAG
ncbi:hypothetical protein B0H13DRAFT_993473 [Mycena leptocephala]|nr:hypothetical protein B0H13DRAFT_993473 [Mycena leptocephala]